jgi:glycosyltransferase involved in cell wall biosynthesis
MSTYRRTEFLRQQIEGILKQSFPNFEIVISDNDPDASAKEVVASFDDRRVIYHHNESNLGMVKSFNNSLSKARGEYVVMITDDDPIYSDMLETLFNLSKKYPGYGVYHGGCEILCYTPFTAKAMRAKVGINSCLSSTMDYNEERVYSGEEFPYVYFNSKLGSLLLWSVNIVKREILLQNGGMPDYGTEYFTDHAYTVANCSHSGMVYLNRSLGHQAIHGDNFGFSQLKNLDKYKKAPESFCNWIEERLGKRKDWPQVKMAMHSFVGRSMVEFSLFIHRSLKHYNLPDRGFKAAFNEVFKLPYLRKWRYKYLLLSRFPATFQYLLQLKQRFSNKQV